MNSKQIENKKKSIRIKRKNFFAGLGKVSQAVRREKLNCALAAWVKVGSNSIMMT